MEFLQKAAQLIATFPNAVEREVYAGRAAQAVGIGLEAMKMEVSRAYKKRTNRAERRREQQLLSPAAAIQPKVRSIRYDNVRSAAAEEGILYQVLREPALFDQAGDLTGSQFSVPVLGRAFDELKDRHERGLQVSLAVLEDFTPDELTHLSAVAQKQDALVSEAAFSDYLSVIREQSQKTQQNLSQDALMDLQARLKRKKGYGGQ